MSIVFLSLGSNLFDKRKNIYTSIKYIEKFSKVIKKSPLYKTSPVGYLSQPFFFNCVVKIETGLGPITLLEKLKLIEKLMGRKKTFKWHERVIDLDILFYENSIIQTKNLVVPHKELHNRKFVLYPLSDIEERYIHPIFKKTVLELKYSLRDSTQKIEKL